MVSAARRSERYDRLRIGLTFNLRKPGTELADRYAEWDDESTVAAVAEALGGAGEVVRLEATEDLPFRLHRARPDIVFNLAEGSEGPNREAHVPALCEFWSMPYTGSDPMTLSICLDKARTKEILGFHRVPTPGFGVVSGAADGDSAPAPPVVVKPLHEGSSKGITQASLCRTRAETDAAVARVLESYGQPAIVERWLPGREFTCAIIGNGRDARALPLVEIDFDALPAGVEKLYSYEAKWIWDTPERPLEIFRCPAPISAELTAAVTRVALTAFRVLRCRDWARVDLRCDEQGTPHVLEVNPLPGVLPDPAMNSCFPKAARAAGLDYEAMIVAVLAAGAARYGLTL
jgi:D-alanine-D-alanine ligase